MGWFADGKLTSVKCMRMMFVFPTWLFQDQIIIIFVWQFLGIRKCINTHWTSMSKHRGTFSPTAVTFVWTPPVVLPFVLLTAQALLWSRKFIHLSQHYSFVLSDATWLKPCTLSIFICHSMPCCSLTPRSPKARVFYIKPTCLLTLSRRGQLPNVCRLWCCGPPSPAIQRS